MNSKNLINQMTEQYEGFIFDLWGVVHDGFAPYPGVLAYLAQLNDLGKSIIFLSNAPRPSSEIIQKLLAFGIKITPEMLLTSGDMVRQQLQNFDDGIFKNLGKSFYHLGQNRNLNILAGISVNLVDELQDANFVLLTAYLNADEDLNQYDHCLASIVSLNLPVICVNPDKEIMSGPKTRYCAGFLAEKIEKMGGVVHYYGKPYLRIYEEVFKRFQIKGIVDKRKILAFGDTLETDILGAKNAGIDSALVLTGNIGRHLKSHQNNTPSSEILSHLFQQYQLMPRLVFGSFDCSTLL
jgi:HAD superfamily hydrolase (TIGR01459 family)